MVKSHPFSSLNASTVADCQISECITLGSVISLNAGLYRILLLLELHGCICIMLFGSCMPSSPIIWEVISAKISIHAIQYGGYTCQV